eukprot:TRINITY_DN10881_c0_g1_i1.p1 TRINITY_DN10881_c0_g1~~TRINITY_DN10881_c0_g1_i1.p1  ORF type:complete len:355 (-),score=72.29 TRINITY_DN10881_c0_g1_i1:230-1252(-)
MSSLASEEITLLSKHSGLTLSAKSWKSQQGEEEDGRPIRKILALHGWLDNAATWDGIAPLLIEAARRGETPFHVHLVCLDLPGHGKSQHRPLGSTYDYGSYIADVFSILEDALKWDKDVTLLGHSMGAAIVSLITALDSSSKQQKRISSLMLVEGFGLWTAEGSAAPKIMLDAIYSHRALSGRKANVYPNFDSAVKKLLENNKDLSEAGAKTLVRRATVPYKEGSEDNEDNETTVLDEAAPVVFRHDVKLRAGGYFRFTEEQNLAFLTSISVPTLVVLGVNGHDQLLAAFDGRKKAVLEAGNIKSFKDVRVPGAHHVHLDAPEAVFPHLLEFLKETTTSK